MGGRGSPQAKQVAMCTGLNFPQEGHVRRSTAEHEGQRSASSATGALQKAQFTGGWSTVNVQPSTLFSPCYWLPAAGYRLRVTGYRGSAHSLSRPLAAVRQIDS